MRQTSTGDPPYPLMFGRKLSSPVELVFKTNLNEDKRVLIEFIENSRQKLDHSYQLAEQNIKEGTVIQQKSQRINIKQWRQSSSKNCQL